MRPGQPRIGIRPPGCAPVGGGFHRPGALRVHQVVRRGCPITDPSFITVRPETAVTQKEKKMKASIASMTLIASLAGPALAGGPTEPAPEPVVAPAPVAPPVDTGGEWGGAYVGAQLGYGDVDSNGGGLDGDGILGGVHAGYRYDFGKAVVGGEIDYDTAAIDLGATAGDELESVARLKLMAGADLGRTLVYGTAGYAYAEASVGGGSLSDDGWFAGLGADYALTDQWRVGGELLTHKFDNFDGSGVDLDVNTVKAKVSFAF
jgi:opacity protein-like surface antigen